GHRPSSASTSSFPSRISRTMGRTSDSVTNQADQAGNVSSSEISGGWAQYVTAIDQVPEDGRTAFGTRFRKRSKDKPADCRTRKYSVRTSSGGTAYQWPAGWKSATIRKCPGSVATGTLSESSL